MRFNRAATHGEQEYVVFVEAGDERSCRLAMPGMVEGGFRRIIVIGSSNVRRPISFPALSNVPQIRLSGLFKDLAVAWGIRL